MNLFSNRIVGIICCFSALLTTGSTYLFWLGSGLRTRPWHIEACIESSFTAARARPDYAGDQEARDLAEELASVRNCLQRVERKWLPLRNYDACMGEILQTWVHAHFFKLKAGEQKQNARKKLEIMSAILKQELDLQKRGGRIAFSYDLRDLDRKRAQSLLQQAERLAAQNHIESALTLTLQAWVSFRKFSERADSLLARFEDERLRQKWDQQVRELIQWSKKTGKRAILIDKFAHRCILLRGGQVERSYRVSLGRSWYLQKTREHDASTPEGQYKITKLIRSSKYGLALLLNYPTEADRANLIRLKRSGQVSGNTRLGGNIEIHGGGRISVDWTDGCIALENDDMRYLYQRAYVGMPVTIVGISQLAASLGNP